MMVKSRARCEGGMDDDPVHLVLSQDEALVLFELLAR
jgi:hypothetical protein